MLFALIQAAKTDDTGCYLGCAAVIVIPIVLFWIAGLVGSHKHKDEVARRASLSPDERDVEDRKNLEDRWGALNAMMICPHCQSKGTVRTKKIIQKKGVSGGKATAAVLTGGVSLMATGLARKEEGTHAICDTCGNKWVF